ncbi:hypothetical protein ACR9E3_16750 [Actinomycetospora sp. C-140]
MVVVLSLLVTVVSIAATVVVLFDPFAASAGAPVTAAPTSAPAAAPTSVSAPADPRAALQDQRQSDASAAEALVGSWIPQLSAKREGMVVDGTSYDAAAVLADHQRLRAAHPDALLVWSGAFTSFRGDDFWVTVVNQPFPTANAANAWCANNGIIPDDCYAKRLSHTGGYAGNTAMRTGAGTTAGTTPGGIGTGPATGAQPTLGDASWVPGGRGFGDVRPGQINANGDGTSHADDVTWESWGGPEARGRGTAYWVPPDGIQADAVARPAIIVASDLGDCHGHPGYRSVSWYFPTEGETGVRPGDGYDAICDPA